MLSVQMDMLSSYEQITWPSGQNYTQKKALIRPEKPHSAVLKAVQGTDEKRALKMVKRPKRVLLHQKHE